MGGKNTRPIQDVPYVRDGHYATDDPGGSIGKCKVRKAKKAKKNYNLQALYSEKLS